MKEKSETNPPNKTAAVTPTRLRREPTERMWRIHELLAAGTYPNCSALAHEFEVSHKTAKRDIDFMRDHFDLPIEYDRQHRGFRYTQPVDRFPGEARMTEAEIFSLLIAHKVTSQYEGLPFQKTLEAGFRKLIARLDHRRRQVVSGFYDALSFRPVGAEEPDARAMALLATALSEGRALAFDYRKPGSKQSDGRHVLPYHVACIDNRFYLVAHDRTRGDLRTFALNRISNPALTADRFERPKNFDPEIYLRKGFAAMTGSGDYEILVEFDSWATDIMRGCRWHKTQEITHLAGGASRFRVRVSCLEEIERWILSWGTHANVISPVALTERLANSARALCLRYSAKPTCCQN